MGLRTNLLKVRDILASGYVTITGALTAGGNTSIGGTLAVTDNTTLSGTLAVTGNTTLSGTLAVTGNTTLSGTLSYKDTIVTDSTGAVTIDATYSNKVLIATKSNAATTVTLPTPASGLTGVRFRVIQTVDQDLVIDGTADKMIVFGGDGTSKTATFSTSNEKLGAGAYCLCTGTMWIVTGLGKSTITVT